MGERASFEVTSFAKKRCFLFDLDGTLLDSSAAHAQAFRLALSEGYSELAAGFDYAKVRGLDTTAAFRRLGLRDPALVSRLAVSKRAHYRELVAAGRVSLFSGATDLLEALRRADRILVLVTSASRAAVELVLAKASIAHYFDTVITVDDVSATKPDPEPFLRALAHFSGTRAECLTVEDTLDGITASRQAGVDAVLVHGVVEGVPSFPSLGALQRSLRLPGGPLE